jgi:hypothetical protein
MLSLREERVEVYLISTYEYVGLANASMRGPGHLARSYAWRRKLFGHRMDLRMTDCEVTFKGY